MGLGWKEAEWMEKQFEAYTPKQDSGTGLYGIPQIHS